MTKSEKICNEIASKFMLSDFTYKDLYYLKDGIKTELCDGLIECGNTYILMQIKERCCEVSSDDENWISKKVYKKAVSQIKDSMKAITETAKIYVNDMYEQAVDINKEHQIIPVIVFFNDKITEYEKVYISSTGLAINVFSSGDYEKMMNVLVVPIDILDYLEYRRQFFQKTGLRMFPNFIVDDNEDFVLMANIDNEKDFAEYFQLKTNKEARSFSGAMLKFLFIMNEYRSRMIKYEKNYKEIIKRLIILKRSAIVEFVERWEYVAKEELKESLFERYMIVENNHEQYGILFSKTVRGNPKDNQDFYRTVIELFCQKFRLDTAILFNCFDEKKGNYFIETMYYNNKFHEDRDLKKFLEENDMWNKGKFLSSEQ